MFKASNRSQPLDWFFWIRRLRRLNQRRHAIAGWRQSFAAPVRAQFAPRIVREWSAAPASPLAGRAPALAPEPPAPQRDQASNRLDDAKRSSALQKAVIDKRSAIRMVAACLSCPGLAWAVRLAPH